LLLAAHSGILGWASALNNEDSDASRKAGGSTPRLLPVPASVSGVRAPVLSLAGEWKFTASPPAEFWKPELDTSAWRSVEMPNEFVALGHAIAPNVEYPCRRKIRIPADFRNQLIFLRFDGVYGYARVWINGVYLRDHNGGFTSWDCEITPHVNPGEDAELVLGITDRGDDISQASFYAKHSVAGILRDARIFAVPPVCLSSLDASATFDVQSKSGILNLAAGLSQPNARSARLHLALTGDSGAVVPLNPNSIPFGAGETKAAQKIVIQPAKSWDAEHPNLYTLQISLEIDGQVVESMERKIGFRTIRRDGNRLLVNGRPVKLRGVCRHSIHPIQGRVVPAEFDEMDAALFRAANINFVRTSHYPPSEQFLDACDRHGIYLEEETAVCWSHVDNGPSSNPEFTSRFLSQFQEMIERDRDHASVLFWSLGNESQWGANFAAERRFAAEHDPTRPVIFSYPDNVPLETSAYDIYSRHYADVNSDLGSSTYPLLNDEFAHVPCYILDVLRRDPGVRSFWGASIQRFGEKFLTADGCLGGSIWAGIDEVFLLPDRAEGYGPWGIIDGWRRPKPEYWLTAKAYSPIRIEDRPLPAPAHGDVLSIPITNAFDHTNLNEIEIHWSAGSDSGQLPPVDLAPHRSGYLEIPPREWIPNDVLQLDFSAKGKFIDQFRLGIDPTPPSLPRPKPAPAVLSPSGSDLLITGPNFSVTVSQATGLIRQAQLNGQVILTGGPYLDLGTGPITSHWLLRHFEAVATGDTVTIFTSGECKKGDSLHGNSVDFEIEIDGSGLISTRYRFQADPAESGASTGVAYILPAAIDRLSWLRDSLWSVYPGDHIGRPKGVALKKAAHAPLAYRAQPQWSWSEDTEDAFLWGKDSVTSQATNDFRSLKENIRYASCTLAGSPVSARAEANADVAVRASVLPDGRVSFSLYNVWSYPGLVWGNYTGQSAPPAQNTREVRLRLTDLS
jgi:hypothetical protein